MNKTLAVLALMLLLSAGSCTPTPTEQPDPLVLPYPLYEQEFHGSQVTVTLQTSSDAPYEFLMTAHTAEGQIRFGVYVITVALTEDYQQGMSVDWTERIGDNTGTGGLWEGESLGAQDLISAAGYGLGDTADYPAAVFVRVVANDPNDPNITYEQTYGPVAVLQILPAGQGVVRLDQ